MTTIGRVAEAAAHTLFTSPAATLRRLTAEDAQMRIPLALNRRIACVQVAPGSGASTVSAHLANMLASRRSGNVLGVSAAAGSRNLLSVSGLHTTSPEPASDLRRNAATSAEAVAGLRRTGSGLFVLDPRPEHGLPASVPAWTSQVMPITRFFELTITDWGVRSPEHDLGPVVSRSHTVCIVARADRYSAELAASLAPAIQAQPTAPAVVLVLVDVDGRAGRAPFSMRRDGTLPIIVVPHEPQLARTEPLGNRPLSGPVRRAYSSLAAAVSTGPAPTPSPPNGAS